MPQIPFWVATTIPPQVTAQPGLEAVIVVPQPTWADASLVYTVTQIDANGSTDPEVSSTTVDDSGNASLTVENLTEGDQVAFTVTVTDGALSVTSLPTEQITATT